jgi:hypothetical protein
MELWDNRLSSALLGTERGRVELTDDAPDVLRQITADSPEHMLLAAAVVSAAYRRAGYIPPTAAASLDAPAPEETLPACKPRTAHFLRVMLETRQYADLLPEWLEIVARKGKRVPHPYLPWLFEVASQQKKDARLVALVANAMGERGRWLATQNSVWEFALLADIGIEQIEPSSEIIEANEAKAIEILTSDRPFMGPGAMTSMAGMFMFSLRPPWTWSDTVFKLFLEKLMKELADSTSHVENALTGFVAYLPPSSLAALANRLKAANENKRTGFEGFLQLIEFRRDMLQELAHE